jgi:hypothetical protein
VGGGEAGFVVSDPSDPDIVYAGEYAGSDDGLVNVTRDGGRNWTDVEIVYDILAQKGGAQLYSRLPPLLLCAAGAVNWVPAMALERRRRRAVAGLRLTPAVMPDTLSERER